MRRAGHNPTDIEVLDIINKIDNETGGLDFEVNDGHCQYDDNDRSMQEFCYVMQDISKDEDLETGYKETFRVFSKDEEGCITADEIMLVTLCLISASLSFCIGLLLNISLARSKPQR